jgi:hypothetical protein
MNIEITFQDEDTIVYSKDSFEMLFNQYKNALTKEELNTGNWSFGSGGYGGANNQYHINIYERKEKTKVLLLPDAINMMIELIIANTIEETQKHISSKFIDFISSMGMKAL